ncbi:unnamed protein product [Plutella xylostella]|uniref:(diamondback moth) hypothetical protein n=1 Tax=Plutella xylostella TaxID=51655 RepID=A0A8S4FVU2_PLUXY|nr:unnamed protein product [Plutella xylostella]
MGLSDTPTCRFCNEEDETPMHILCECEAIIHKRNRILGGYKLAPIDVRSLPPGKIIRFIKDLGLDRTSDYIAVNHYSSRAVRQHQARVPAAESSPFSSNFEFNVTYEGRPEWKKGRSFWFLINPTGLRNVLSWLKARYGDHEVVITENGYSDVPDVVNDDVRINYFREYLTQVHRAITEDGVNVTGYTAWSLMDNFEWVEGYKSTFGLYQVDFSQADRPRTPRKSARYYASVVRANSLDVPEPQDVIMM